MQVAYLILSTVFWATLLSTVLMMQVGARIK